MLPSEWQTTIYIYIYPFLCAEQGHDLHLFLCLHLLAGALLAVTLAQLGPVVLQRAAMAVDTK